MKKTNKPCCFYRTQEGISICLYCGGSWELVSLLCQRENKELDNSEN